MHSLKVTKQHTRISYIMLFMLSAGNLYAAETSTEEPVNLSNLIIEGEKGAGQYDKTLLNDQLLDVPGGTNLVDLSEVTTSQSTLSDVLGNEPGIIMQEFFGGNDQPRLNIRGSGIQDNPVNRGVQLLSNGLPLNQADGSFIIGLLAPQQMRYVSVYRGANALQYGGATLGGAINMIPRTGLNSNNFVQAEGGSNSLLNGNFGVGGANESWDYYISGGQAQSDGFRNHSESERIDLAFNVGYQINDNIENRTYFNYTDNYFQIPFVVQKGIALDHPEAVLGDGYASAYAPPSALPAPAVNHPSFGWNARGGWDGVFNAYKRNPRRESEQFRLANTTRMSFDHTDHELGVFAETVDDVFTDPLSHAVVEADNFGIQYAFNTTGDLITSQDDLLISLTANQGSMPTEYWVNNPEDGTRLFQFADLDMDANNVALNMQYTAKVHQRVQLVTGLQWLHYERDIKGTASTPPSQGFDKVVADVNQDLSFDTFNPKLGLIYEADESVRFFTNLSRSMEAPTFNHLVTRTVGALIVPGETSPPSPPFTDAEIASGAVLKDLKAQTAWTLELGTQGEWQDTSWQMTYYHSKVEDELITLVTGFAVNAETLNYTDGTTHQGVELGFNTNLGNNLLLGGDSLNTNIVYNYSHFTFDGGIYSGNQIAGIPEHLGYVELAYQPNDKILIAPNMRWQPSDTYVDHSNTQVQDAFMLLGIKASYKATDAFRLYADLDNINDETYQTSYVIRGISDVNQPTFLPGQGFSFSVGATYSW
ncbi:TonB-dependent receptor family protein [Alkalimarinus alittae]|uniref:TonB-dependent receptor n=1 Tax=Alkalimarinus alittae TaxID=2961619 RepID=A0ABY6N4U4_9ALTE|nr:TonB-dependent receptor [Alkalimarinus alittae]UZE97060.1 TonB-dependent receptor [Alkalimarinus alittae]